MFNIDETEFGQTIKNNYSWLPKVLSATIINDVYLDRANLILGVSQFGDYSELLYNSNTME